MRKLFYARLAAQNMRKNAQTYVPYLITCVCAVAMYYIVYALSLDDSAGATVASVLHMGVQVMAIFSVAFLFYTNSFLMKRRKKEFGLFNVLGMEKRHIARIIFFETLYAFTAALVLGLGLGLGLFKLAHLVLLNLLQFNIRFGFSVSFEAIGASLLLFGIIFVLLLLWSLLQIGRVRPIELIQGGQVGEREPKAHWLIALLGLLTLGAGYWLSLTIENPIMVIMLFFVAVALVIVGTYLLFMAGGVALLKLLRRNKGYYYQANHFIAVSGLMYRMKQNAAGLATICILATMVLVMISSTAALYFGIEGALQERYTRQVIFQAADTESDTLALMQETIAQTLAEQGLQAQDQVAYRMVPLFARRAEDTFIVDGFYDTGQDMVDIFLMPLEDYRAFSGEDITLQPQQALLLSRQSRYGAPTLSLLGHTFAVEERFDSFRPFNMSRAYNSAISPIYTLVLADLDTVLALREAANSAATDFNCSLYSLVGFDLDADSATQQQAGRAAALALQERGIEHYQESRAASRAGFFEMYGGLFFLGLFLGFVFMLATVLIIYYKQISEGYDDQRRYAIMQQVGLSRREARRSIHSQILTMFFLPLAMACLHIAFAFPALTRMLSILNLHDVRLFVLTTTLSVVAFAVFYMLVYSLTAKVYERLVQPLKA